MVGYSAGCSADNGDSKAVEISCLALSVQVLWANEFRKSKTWKFRYRKLPSLNPCNSKRSGHQEVGIPLYTLEFYALSSHMTKSEKNFWVGRKMLYPLTKSVLMRIFFY